MTQSEIQNLNDRVTGYVRNGRVRDALRLMRNTTEARMLWEIGDVIGRIEENYAYMLRYLTDGANDPTRQAMYQTIVADVYRILDVLVRRLRTPEVPSLYFSTLRVAQQSHVTLGQLLDKWQEQYAAAAKGGDRAAMERTESEIFRTLWTLMPLSREDTDNIVIRILDPATPQQLKALLMSALTLGLLEYFDAVRLDALIEIYTTNMAGVTALDDDSAERLSAFRLNGMALTGILLALYKYRDRVLPAATAKRLEALRSVSRWHADLRIAALELIRTRNTEKINRTMSEEIIPGMMKMKPDIMNLGKQPFDPETLEANPEWEDMLRKSGLEDKIRAISELQQDGADVFMSTFAHLKNFPFFHEISNWFVPFAADRTDIATTGVPHSLAVFVENLPFLCSSDKYSFFLSLGMVPKQQQDLMLSQFRSQSNQFMEEITHAVDNGTPDDLSRRSIAGYLQNLYRFYNLFRRKGEFYNPFAEGVNLLDVPLLADAFGDPELLRVVAELFFKFGYWEDAARAFGRLEGQSGPEGPVYQKTGYCYQRLGNLDKALEYYHQAEIFSPDNRWLLARIGAAYSESGNHARAAEYYARLSELEPENVAYALKLGYAKLILEDYADALKQFYKAEYLDNGGSHAWRPLAWTLFLSRRFEDSKRYYDKIAGDKPTATDWLNMGHLAMATGAYKEALTHYRASLAMRHDDTEAILADLDKDAKALQTAGVDNRTRAMVTDALLYSLKS